jgi:hypothetical protein
MTTIPLTDWFGGVPAGELRNLGFGDYEVVFERPLRGRPRKDCRPDSRPGSRLFPAGAYTDAFGAAYLWQIQQSAARTATANGARVALDAGGPYLEIDLGNGHVLKVDFVDADLALAVYWVYHPSTNSVFGIMPTGKRVKAHRLMLGPDAPGTTHVNGDMTDNRRGNLRTW